MHGAPINLPLTASHEHWAGAGCALQVVASSWGGIRLDFRQYKSNLDMVPNLVETYKSCIMQISPKLSLFCERTTFTFHIEGIIYNKKLASGPWIVVDLGNFSKWEYVPLAGLLTSHNYLVFISTKLGQSCLSVPLSVF